MEVGSLSGLCGQSFFGTYISILILALCLVVYAETVRSYILGRAVFSSLDPDFINSMVVRQLKGEITIYSVSMILLYPLCEWVHANFGEVSFEFMFFISISIFTLFFLARKSEVLILKFSYLLITFLVGGVLYLKMFCSVVALDLIAISIALWGLKFRYIEVESNWCSKKSVKNISPR